MTLNLNPSNIPTHHFDIIICGAGLNGCTIALALDQMLKQNIQHTKKLTGHIALIEARPLQTLLQTQTNPNSNHTLNTNPNTNSNFNQARKQALKQELNPNTKLNSKPKPPFPDSRTIALAYGSYLLYQRLGLAPALQPISTPIQSVHVSEKGNIGITHIHSNDWHLPALGYVIPGKQLYSILLQTLAQRLNHSTQLPKCNNQFLNHPTQPLKCHSQRLKLNHHTHTSTHTHAPTHISTHTHTPTQAPTLHLLSPAQLTNLSYNPSNQLSKVTIKHPNGSTHSLTTQLIIGADGAQSKLRSLLNIAIAPQQTQSHQTAIIAPIQLRQPHNGIAYERFVPADQHHPAMSLALLPMLNQQSTLVWALPNDQAKNLLPKSKSDPDFLKAAQQHFGYRLGIWQSVGHRSSAPLYQSVAKELIRPGVVLIGNAAQSLHPIAAQGFNLGLRDTINLIDWIEEAIMTNKTLGDPTLLQAYAISRQRDRSRMQTFTQGLLHTFAKNYPGSRSLRGLGLTAFDILPTLKRHSFRSLLGVL